MQSVWGCFHNRTACSTGWAATLQPSAKQISVNKKVRQSCMNLTGVMCLVAHSWWVSCLQQARRSLANTPVYDSSLGACDELFTLKHSLTCSLQGPSHPNMHYKIHDRDTKRGKPGLFWLWMPARACVSNGVCCVVGVRGCMNGSV